MHHCASGSRTRASRRVPEDHFQASYHNASYMCGFQSSFPLDPVWGSVTTSRTTFFQIEWSANGQCFYVATWNTSSDQ
jgi:hypothetical protein